MSFELSAKRRYKKADSRSVNFRIPNELDERCRKFCEEKGITYSSLVFTAVETLLNNLDVISEPIVENNSEVV